MDSVSENFKIRTAHNELVFYRHGSLIELRARDNSLQSVVDLDSPERLQLRNLEHLMAVLLFIPSPERILLLGTAAGSLLHYLRHYLPNADITSVDIDAELVQMMQQMQLLPEPCDRLDYVFADAAEYVAACEARFDLVLVDIFTGQRSPPWLLTTKFSEELQRICGVSGAVAYNLLLASDHDFDRFHRDLRRLYCDRSLLLPVGGYENRIALAIRYCGQREDMETRMRKAGLLSEQLGMDYLKLLALVYNANPAGRGVL